MICLSRNPDQRTEDKVMAVAVSRSALIENLKKAEVLKEKSLNCQSINNLDVWTNQRKLLNIYEEILMLDLELALDRKVEQDLWNYCFKNYIALLQASAKHNKTIGVGSCAKLSWLLECASGFYLSLLQQICTVFSLDLPFNRRDRVYGILEDGERDRWRGVVSQPSKDSCYYVCQYCLVHLGDIARYRNQAAQASAFYRQAVGVGAWSGQPYNQLGLLGATDPDRLSTVFYYVRSIAAPRPFHNALTNLTNTLAKSLVSKKEEDCMSEDSTGADGSNGSSNGGKVSVVEYETLFLKLLALIHCGRVGQEARDVLSTLNSALTPLIATQQFSPYRLIQMCAVSIWMFESGGNCSEASVGNNETAGLRSSIEEIMSEYISGLLSALLLPLYTAVQDSILSYFALPPVKIILFWLECKPTVVLKLSRISVWRGLCKLLNDLKAANPIPPPQVINDALSEDYDLRGFLPLEKVFRNLNFEGEVLDVGVERRLRGFRLLKLGELLGSSSQNNPIFIREGLFEIVPASSEPNGTTAALQHPRKSQSGTGGTQHEMGRSRIRQNVALQSIMRLSNTPQVEWEARAGSSTLSSDARWWPPGPPVEEVPGWTGGGTGSEPPLQNQEGRMYSLFSGGGDGQISPASSLAPSILRHQSLWSGPGPSPLERLLQQQKNQRSGSNGSHAPPDT